MLGERMTKTPKLGAHSLAGAARNRQRGYSLVEAMIVVLIGLILTGLAVPMVQSALRSYTVGSTANSVSRLIGVARYAGITQGRNSCTLFAGNQFGQDLNCDGAFGSTEVRVQIPVGVTVSQAPPGGVTTAGLPFSPAPTQIPSACTTYAVAFSPRGNKASVCGTASGGAETHVFFLTGWNNTTAITITGTGRARSWRFISGTWQ
jgi:Tfp pilus assembly protein FimT